MNQAELNIILAAHTEWLATGGFRGVRADLSGADLREVSFRGVNLHSANLSDANLRGVDLSNANLSRTHLLCADLSGATVSDANLLRADLSGANLTRSNLTGANLLRSNLSDANLSDANLSIVELNGANLSGASLWGCIGNRKNIKSIHVSEDYEIVYTSEYLQIGCERHLISEWAEFDGNDIFGMDGNRGLDFWRIWKDYIFMTIEKSPAVPTGYKEK